MTATARPDLLLCVVRGGVRRRRPDHTAPPRPARATHHRARDVAQLLVLDQYTRILLPARPGVQIPRVRLPWPLHGAGSSSTPRQAEMSSYRVAWLSPR